MKTTPHLLHVLWLGILWLIGPTAPADTIPVENAGFENPALGDGAAAYGTIPGWTISPGADAGVQNLQDPHFTGSSDPAGGMPEGKNCIYLNTAGTVSQTLAATLQPNTDYTLRVSIGDRKDQVVGAYAVELRAGSQPLGSASPRTVNDAWVVATVHYRALPGDPLLGQPLAIVLRKEATVAGDAVPFDNVQLDASPISDRPLGQGLVAHWKFDETAGTVARDVTGQYDGQLMPNGAALVSGGVAGGALHVDRSKNGMMVVPYVAAIATNDFSVVAWAKVAVGDTTPSTYLFSQYEGWYANGCLILLNSSAPTWGSPGKATVTIETGNDSVTSSSLINDGQWHQIVATYARGGALSIYVDGAPAEASRPAVPMSNRHPPLLLGATYGEEVTAVPNGRYTGWIDDVQLYRRALTDAEVDVLFRNPGKNLADLAPVGVTFTSVTGVPPANEGGTSLSPAWGDYDGDGRLDLFVANYRGGNLLYRNDGGGAFSKVTGGPLATDVMASTGAGWADYDNDGRLDLIVCNYMQDNALYRGTGEGGFARALTFPNDQEAYQGAWGDYDQDGFVDFFIARAAGGSQLWQNQRDGTFKLVETGVMGAISGVALSGSWCDYDNDGRLDLFVSCSRSQPSLLYRNEGGGNFRQVTSGPIATKTGESESGAWGDFDGDGWFDLFVANRLGPNFIYRNNRDGTFAEVTSGDVVSDVANSNGCAWGDYDNDGWLDLLVANGTGQENNFLYHNNGDGTFTRVTAGAIATDTGFFVGCAWADDDDDGDLDLFVTRYNGGLNALYRNDGTPNAWLKVTLTGTASNRAAIGAKVRVKATINGVSRWQVRQLTGNAGWAGQELVAHFGLGNATNVEAVRVEWPSGQVSELTDQAVRQTLSVVEPTPQAIQFVPPGGEFVGSVSVTLKNKLGAGSMFYTTDGSEPTASSTPYTAAILVTKTTTIRVRAFFNGFPISEVFEVLYQRAYAANDGIPDAWQEQYFGPGYLTDPRAAADADPDGDGANNAQEYAAGTNPTDPLSGFVIQVRAVPLISWASVVGQKYRILRKPVVTDPNWTTVVDNYVATNRPSKYADPEAEGIQFYVIEVVP